MAWAVDFAAVRSSLDPAAPNIEALREAVNCAELACTCDLERGLTEERQRFEALMAGDASRVLRQKFFAERQASKRPTPFSRPT